MGVEAWDAISHCSSTLEVVHLVREAEDGTNLVDERGWKKLHPEDDVAAIWDSDHGLLLPDCINDPCHCLFGREDVHWEGTLGSLEHSRVDKVRADASRLNIAIVSVLLELESDALVDGNGSPLARTVVWQAWNSSETRHRGNRNDVSSLVSDHVWEELTDSMHVRHCVHMHRPLDHRISQLQRLVSTDDTRVVDQYSH